MYHLIVKTPECKWLWDAKGFNKEELLSDFKKRYPNWKDLWAQLHDKQNLLPVWVKRPGKCRFVAD